MENSNHLSPSTKAKAHTTRQPWVWSVLTPQPRPLPPSQVTFLWPCSGSRPAPQPGRGHSTPPICSTHSSAPYCWYLLYWKKWRASELCTVTPTSLLSRAPFAAAEWVSRSTEVPSFTSATTVCPGVLPGLGLGGDDWDPSSLRSFI